MAEDGWVKANPLGDTAKSGPSTEGAWTKADPNAVGAAGAPVDAASDDVPGGSDATTAFMHHFIANLPGGEDAAAYLESFSTGKSAAEQKRDIQARGAKDWEEHPWASGAGVGASVLGQVAALPVDLPEEALAQGITRLAPAAADYSPALVRGVARTGVGAGYGAIYGGTSGPDLWDTSGALTGAGLGGAGAAVAPAITKAARGAAQWAGFGDVGGEAAGKIAEAWKKDEPAPVGKAGRAMDQATFDKAQAAGQPVAAVDLGGENIRELADVAQTRSAEARSTLVEPAQEHFDTQGQRFADYVKGTFPGDLNTAVQRDEVEQAARVANSTAYNAAYNDPNAQAVWSPKLATIMRDPNVQAAIPAAQRNAASAAVDESLRTGNPVQFPKSPFVSDGQGGWDLARDAQGNAVGIPNLRWWDQINRALGDQVTTARSAANMNTARVVGGIQNHLQSELDAQVPQFAQARAGAAGFFGEQKLIDAAVKFNRAQDEPTINELMQDLVGRPAAPGLPAIPPRSDAQREVFARAYASQLIQKALNPAESVDISKQLTTGTLRKKFAALNTPSNPTRGNEIEAWLLRDKATNQALKNYGNSKSVQRILAQAKHPEGHGLVGSLLQGFSAPASGAATGAIGAYEGTSHEASWAHTLKNMGYGAASGALLGWMGQRRGAVNAKVWNEIARQLASPNRNIYEEAVKRVARRPLFMQAYRNAMYPLIRQESPRPGTVLAGYAGGQWGSGQTQ